MVKDPAGTVTIGFQQGVTCSFVVNQPDDLRGAVIAAEVTKGDRLSLVEGVSGTVAGGSSTINLSYDAFACKDKCIAPGDKLALNPFYRDDALTLLGADLVKVPVLASGANQIIVSGTAARAVTNGRLQRYARSLASFAALPILREAPDGTRGYFIATTAIANINATTIQVDGPPVELPNGTILVYGTQSVTLRAVAKVGDNLLQVNALTAAIPSGTIARVRATGVLVRSDSTGAVLNVDPLECPIPANTVLHFGQQVVTDDRYVGAVTVATTALEGENTIAIADIGSRVIPLGSIAFYCPIPFYSYRLSLAPSDTNDLAPYPDLKFDVKQRLHSGVVNKYLKGSLTLFPHSSDI